MVSTYVYEFYVLYELHSQVGIEKQKTGVYVAKSMCCQEHMGRDYCCENEYIVGINLSVLFYNNEK